MNKEIVQVVGKIVTSVVGTLVVGEVFGGAISRPIAVWRQRNTGTLDPDKVGELFDAMNQRICDLEEKQKE